MQQIIGHVIAMVYCHSYRHLVTWLGWREAWKSSVWGHGCKQHQSCKRRGFTFFFKLPLFLTHLLFGMHAWVQSPRPWSAGRRSEGLPKHAIPQLTLTPPSIWGWKMSFLESNLLFSGSVVIYWMIWRVNLARMTSSMAWALSVLKFFPSTFLWQSAHRSIFLAASQLRNIQFPMVASRTDLWFKFD